MNGVFNDVMYHTGRTTIDLVSFWRNHDFDYVLRLLQIGLARFRSANCLDFGLTVLHARYGSLPGTISLDTIQEGNTRRKQGTQPMQTCDISDN